MATSQDPGPSGADIARQIKTIQDDIATLTKLVREVAEAKSDGARETALGEAQKLIDKSIRAADHVSESARNAAGSLEDYIREKPVQSTIIALLVGVLVGSLTRR